MDIDNLISLDEPNRGGFYIEEEFIEVKLTEDRSRYIFKCDQCEASFTRNAHLKLHKQSKHEGRRYSCEKCESVFVRPEKLKLHIKNKHEGITYPCDHCEHAAPSPQGLKYHINNKHRYQCEACILAYQTTGELKYHREKKHRIFTALSESNIRYKQWNV